MIHFLATPVSMILCDLPIDKNRLLESDLFYQPTQWPTYLFTWILDTVLTMQEKKTIYEMKNKCGVRVHVLFQFLRPIERVARRSHRAGLHAW